MKKLTTFFVMLLMCGISFLAHGASITAADVDFGSVSIKGQNDVQGTASVNVSWSGLSNMGYSIYAEVTDGDDYFYVAGESSYYMGYGDKMTYSTTFSVGYIADKAGTYTGKLRFYSYDTSFEEVQKVINLKLVVTNDAIVEQTTTFTKVNSTSELQDGDVIIFASESAAAVCGKLNGTYLPAVTQGVKFSGNNVDIPQDALTITLKKNGGNWQMTDNSNSQLLLSDISGKGAFTYGSASPTLLADWSIDIANGEARVATPSDEFPVLFNSDRFKPYKSESAGTLPSLYKKTSEAHDVVSKVALAEAINLGTAEMSETVSAEVAYEAEYLTDVIVWSVGGADAAYFSVKAEGDNKSGKLTITYNGKAQKTGALDAKVEYLTQNAALDMMEGSFPININLVGNTVKLTSLAFDEAAKTLYLGETLDLGKSVIFTPADAADKSLVWESSNKYYATVDENGVVTPLISGKVTITATSVRVPDVSATCEVTIKVPEATGVQIDQPVLTLNIGGKGTLVASVLPAGAAQDVTWSSSNTDVATVSTKGMVTAKALGDAIITATVKSNTELTATCIVSVVATTVENISFAESSVSVTVGGVKQLEPVITPASAADDNEIIYKSANEAIATVNADGLVKGVAQGQTTITASVAGKSASIIVNVVAPQMFTKVSDPAELKDKDTIILAVTGIYGDTEYTVVAGPRDNKVLTPLKDNVIVNDSYAYADDALRLVLGATTGGFTLTPVGASKALAESGGNDFVEANTKNNKVWEFVADGTNGVYVHNVGNDNAYIKYNPAPNVDAIRPYKVNTVGAVLMYVYVRPFVDKPVEVVHPTGITLSQSSLDLKPGDTHQLTATVTPSNADNKSVTWSSSDENVAVVSPQGIVRAIDGGEAVITATTVDGGLTAECVVTVTGSMPTGDKGTEENPYTVADVILLNNSVSESAWVMGYIWGSPKSGKALGDNTDTSFALGDDKEYTEGASFVPVELPKGDIRTDLGLATHPEYVGRKIKVYGSLKAYFSVPGVKSTSKYVWLDEYTGVENVQSDGLFNIGDGTISFLTADYNNAAVYNMQGQLIACGVQTVECQSGLFIIRIADKAYKVIVK